MHHSSFKVGAALLVTGALLKISAVAAAVAVLGLGSAAHASSLGRPCTSAPKSQWLPIQELQAKVEALGYKVQKGKVAKACGEFYTLDKDGKRVEVFVDPTNGQIAGQL